MTDAELIRFKDALRNDPPMASDLRIAVGDESGQQAARTIVTFANERGYTITFAEVAAQMLDGRTDNAISDEDLENVAGGSFLSVTTHGIRI